MTRLETAVAAVTAAVLLAVHAPAVAQTIVVDGEVTEAPKAQVTIRAKGKPTKAPAAPKPPEEPTFRVLGGLENNKDRARDSAIRAAAEKVHEYLLEQEPPVERCRSIWSGG